MIDTSNYSYTGLPAFVVDDDFIEHLHENGFQESIELDELVFEWIDWEKENLDESN